MAPTSLVAKVASNATEDLDSDVISDKDETEERLEKLIFGHEAGFLKSLNAPRTSHKQTSLVQIKPEDKNSSTEQDESFENIDDENLFFLDSGPGPLPPNLNGDGTGSHDQDRERQPAWTDSDDDRVYVSLASNARLRKLRNTEGEDVINGREYIKRLRRQYEQLHPSPAWAQVSPNGRANMNGRNTSQEGEPDNSSDENASDMSLDDDTSTQPPTKALADLLRTVGSLTRSPSSSQPPGPRLMRPEVVDIQRTKDVSGHGPSTIDCLQFHPYYPLLLSSGPSSTASLYHIDPHAASPNPLLTALHIKKTPLHTTAFLAHMPTVSSSDSTLNPEQTTIYLTSRHRYLHTWSLNSGTVDKITRPFTTSPHLRQTQRSTESFALSPDGQYIAFAGSARKGGGHVNIFTTVNMAWLCSCRVDSRGGVADFAWWRNGEGIAVVGKNGECTEYDVRERRAVGRWRDDGAVGTTVVALGGSIGSTTKAGGPSPPLGGSRWVAIGSSSGIVNIYDRAGWGSTPPAHPTPLRTLTQLTTPTSHLTFSTDGQMLVMSSRWKKDALRLVHLPSCTVYQNWPTDKTPLGRVSSVALSPDGGYLAVGNEQGRIRLWEIRE